jgi:hypothetical protein
MPNYFRFQGVKLKHGVFQHNWQFSAISDRLLHTHSGHSSVKHKRLKTTILDISGSSNLRSKYVRVLGMLEPQL